MNVRALMGDAGKQVTEAQCREFERALADNMLPSIDALLEHRSDLWPVGKRVMATLLYSEEATARPPPTADDWMAFVFERMAEDAASLPEFAKNSVEFITFNYDRYLEHRLIRGLVARYKVDARDAWNCLRGTKFLHLYGSLGELPEQAEKGVSTAIPLGAADRDGIYTLGVALPQVENSVRIVHDPTGVDLPAVFKEAQASFARAKQILFFGFGFGRTNVARLGTKEISTSTGVYCTALGMTNSEIEYLIRPAFPQFPHLTRPEYVYVKASPIRQYLRDSMSLLT